MLNQWFVLGVLNRIGGWELVTCNAVWQLPWNSSQLTILFLLNPHWIQYKLTTSSPTSYYMLLPPLQTPSSGVRGKVKKKMLSTPLALKPGKSVSRCICASEFQGMKLELPTMQGHQVDTFLLVYHLIYSETTLLSIAYRFIKEVRHVFPDCKIVGVNFRFVIFIWCIYICCILHLDLSEWCFPSYLPLQVEFPCPPQFS